jgi:hypothetical protein
MIHLITTLLKQKEEYEDETIFEVPVCGSNFKTPVIDQVYYIGDIHYKIGDRMYIVNAD